MDNFASDSKGVVLRLSETEFVIANNSLNEVSHGVRIPESEFEARLGASRSETKRLLDAIREAVSSAGSTTKERVGRAVGSDVIVEFEIWELEILVNAMVEMTKGVEIEEWEYPIRLGATVAEGKQLLAEVEDVVRKASA